MRSLVLLLALSACAVQRPVWGGDPGVQAMCEQPGAHSFTHQGETRTFTVHYVDRLPCIGARGKGCIVGKAIYVINGGQRDCSETMAHELSHGFGLDFVDRPHITQ